MKVAMYLRKSRQDEELESKENTDTLSRHRKKLLEEARKRRIKEHKCNGCVWGRWSGKSYVCILPRCMKKLGSFKR